MRSFFNPVHTVGVAGASSTNKASGAPKSLGDGEGKRKLPEPSSKDDDTTSPEKQARTKGSSARSQGASDDLGALLHTWRVEDARPALEANGFTSVQRMRDVLEADDLPELGLPLATRKILARLLKHWADEKRAEQAVQLTQQVPGLLELQAEPASEEAAAAAAVQAALTDALYNSEATHTIRRWQPFHRAISEKIAAVSGSFQLRAVEEVQLDAPVNEEALNTSLLPPPSEDKDGLPETEALSGGRGGRYEAARKRVLAPPPPVTPGKKQKRHFRYRSREGDFFVKVVLTGERIDMRGDDEKEDTLGDMMSMLLSGDLEAGKLTGRSDDLDSLVMSLGQAGVGNGGGGLILEVPDGFQESLFGPEEKSVQGRTYPHNLYEGEQVALKALRSTGQMRMPAPIVAGDLLDPEYVKNQESARRDTSELFSGGYGVLEWVELKRDITPNIVSDVAEQLARLHIASEGMSTECGFSVNTFLGQREQDNTIQQGADVLEFFASRRLEPEIDAATRTSGARAAKISARLRDDLGTKGFKVCLFILPTCASCRPHALCRLPRAPRGGPAPGAACSGAPPRGAARAPPLRPAGAKCSRCPPAPAPPRLPAPRAARDGGGAQHRRQSQGRIFTPFLGQLVRVSCPTVFGGRLHAMSADPHTGGRGLAGQRRGAGTQRRPCAGACLRGDGEWVLALCRPKQSTRGRVRATSLGVGVKCTAQ